MPDQITEVISRSWFSRIRNSFGGMLVGVVLTVLPFIFLSWNEKRAIDMIRALNEGARSVVSIAADAVNPQNEGALVHFSGRADSPDRVGDKVFGLDEAALKLRRRVETFQWEETRSQESKTKMGGGTDTVVTYHYRTHWSEDLANSGQFKDSASHRNPAQRLFDDHQDVAQPVKVGAFTLPESLVAMLAGWTALPVPSLDRLPPEIRSRSPIAGDFLYFGKDPSRPAVGDTRVRFEVVPPQEVTVVARQVGTTLEPFHANSGASVLLLEPGIHSAADMFAQAQSKNRAMTWILRIVLFVMMGIGLSLVFRPFRVLADVLPFAGRLVGAGTGFVAFLLAAVLSTVTVAIAWLAVRPEIGFPLLLVAGGLAVWLARRMKRAAGPPPILMDAKR